jgi:sulfur carrier protein
MPLSVIINGQPRTFEQLEAGNSLADLVSALHLKSDRIAVEHNGEIAPRASWVDVSITKDDKIELVHFVGGG